MTPSNGAVIIPDSSTPIASFLRSLPESAVVCEVGGASSRQPRADWVVDILSYEQRESVNPDDRVTAERWIGHDICSPRQWPVPDNAFDFTICSHTLEDVTNPFHVVRELMRISSFGYIETPGRAYESARSPYGLVPGSHHHKWLVEVASDGELIFTPKDGRLIEWSSLQINRRVSLETDLVRKYWHREYAPLRAVERFFTEDDCIQFRARFENVSEAAIRRALNRESLKKRAWYKAMRTLRFR